MNKDIRNFYIDVINLVNEYESIPWEARRCVLELITLKIEKQADASIVKEIEENKDPVDQVIVREEENAESL